MEIKANKMKGLRESYMNEIQMCHTLKSIRID